MNYIIIRLYTRSGEKSGSPEIFTFIRLFFVHAHREAKARKERLEFESTWGESALGAG